jgi:cellobiose transport system substrate-binding protein
VLFLIVFTFAMVACSSGNEASTSQPSNSASEPQSKEAGTKSDKPVEPVELVFWLFGATGYDELAKEYQKQHSNVTIKFQSGEWGDHHNNLFTALSAGSGAPDLALVDVSQLERYREAQNKFYNLYDFGAADLKNKYLDWKWQIGESSDGSFLFGVPTDIGPTAMFYRTDVFKEAGLPTDPNEVTKKIATWADFKNVAVEIKNKTGKPMSDSVELVFNAVRDQQPKQYFDSNENLIIESEPYIKKAYDYTVELIKAGVIAKIDLWTPEWSSGMNQGTYATLLGPAWMQGYMKGNAPDGAGKWAITTMPEGAGNWGGSYVVVPKDSKHSEVAADFAKWLVSPENQLKSFKSHGLFPSASSVYGDEDFKNFTDPYYNGAKTAEAFAKAAEQVRFVYQGKNWGTANTEILNALINVQRKDGDPAEEWKAAIERIKTQINK